MLKYRQGVSSSIMLSFLPPAVYCHPTMSRKRGEGLCCDPVMHLAACHGQAPPTALKYAQRSITIMLQPCSGHCVVISVASAGFRGATGCSASLSCAASQRSSRCVHTSGGWEAKNRRRRNVAGWKWEMFTAAPLDGPFLCPLFFFWIIKLSRATSSSEHGGS